MWSRVRRGRGGDGSSHLPSTFPPPASQVQTHKNPHSNSSSSGTHKLQARRNKQPHSAKNNPFFPPHPPNLSFLDPRPRPRRAVVMPHTGFAGDGIIIQHFFFTTQASKQKRLGVKTSAYVRRLLPGRVRQTERQRPNIYSRHRFGLECSAASSVRLPPSIKKRQTRQTDRPARFALRGSIDPGINRLLVLFSRWAAAHPFLFLVLEPATAGDVGGKRQTNTNPKKKVRSVSSRRK